MSDIEKYNSLIVINLSKTLLGLNKSCKSEEFENEYLKIKLLVVKNRKTEGFSYSKLLIYFKHNENLQICSLESAQKLTQLLSNIYSASFGTYIPPGDLVFHDGEIIIDANNISNDSFTVNHGLIETGPAIGSCIGFNLENLCHITISIAYLNIIEDWLVIENAAMFYTEALLSSRHSANISYALLISSLECLAITVNIKSDVMIDEIDLELIDKISNHPDFGENDAQRIKSRFYQLKRKVVRAACSCFDEKSYSFTTAGSPKSGDVLVQYSDWPKRISASYDLRSAFMHTGDQCIELHMSWRKSNYQIIKDSIKNPNTRKILKNSLTIYQLGSIVQHCISYAIKNMLIHKEVQSGISNLGKY